MSVFFYKKEQMMDLLRSRIELRIDQQRKKRWKEICSSRKLSFTQLIIDSVEDRIMDDERRSVLSFIEKQDNIFVKIETNVNQIARIVNSQKYMPLSEIQDFQDKLKMIVKLKEDQNETFRKIYSILAR